MFGIYAIGFLSNYLFSMLMGVLAQKVQFRVRNETFTHMESLPIAYFDQNTRWVFGYPLLKEYYTIFDKENMKIYFKKLN